MAKTARKVIMSEEPEPSGLADLLNQTSSGEPLASQLAPPAVPGGVIDPGPKPKPDDDETDKPRREPDDDDPPRREPGDEDEDDQAAHRRVDDWPDGGGPQQRAAGAIIDGEIIPAGGPPAPAKRPAGLDVGPIRYESRIRILEAFQYKGSLLEAPGWVDRNWAAHADFDPLRNIQAGPALRVPSQRGDWTLVRPGDYVVRQEVVLAAGLDPDVQLECWPQESFERLFIPTP